MFLSYSHPFKIIILSSTNRDLQLQQILRTSYNISRQHSYQNTDDSCYSYPPFCSVCIITISFRINRIYYEQNSIQYPCNICAQAFLENNSKYISNNDQHNPNKNLLFKCDFLHAHLPSSLSTIFLMFKPNTIQNIHSNNQPCPHSLQKSYQTRRFQNEYKFRCTG